MEIKKQTEVTQSIAGARVLVVEDDPFIQLDLENVLVDSGAHVIGPCGSVRDALSSASAHAIDIAILDFGLVNETSTPVARYLDSAGVPFLFYTGQSSSDVRLAEWARRPMVRKPSEPREIKKALAKLLEEL